MAHKKRYKKLSRQLCEQAVVECFKGKWRRNDVLTFIEKYAGIPRDDIKIDDLSGSWKYKNEAVEAIGLAMLGIVEDLVDHGIEPDGTSDDPAASGWNDRKDQGHCTVVHYASADRSYYEIDDRTIDSGAIASDATRKHSGTRADNAERSDVALFPEGIAGNRICEKNRCCTCICFTSI